MDPKLWYTSKQIWLNIIAVIAFLVQKYTHFVIDPQTQAALLILINFILRCITKQPIVWTEAAKVAFKTRCDCSH